MSLTTSLASLGVFFLVAVLASSNGGGAGAARILAVMPHSGRSHHLVFEPLLLELHRRGHELTVLSHFPRQAPPHYHRDLDLRGTMPILDSVLPLSVLQGLNPFSDFMTIVGIGHDSCDPILSLPVVRALLASNETFDLILDEAFNTDCFVGFAHRFRPAAVVSLSSSILMPWSGARVGNPTNPALQPNLFLWFTDSMATGQRVLNACYTALVNTVKALYWDRVAQRVANRHFGPGLPPLRQLAGNTSLILVNAHHSLNLPLPAVPGVVEVGGLHIPDDIEPLPKVTAMSLCLIVMPSWKKSLRRCIDWSLKQRVASRRFASLVSVLSDSEKMGVALRWMCSSLPSTPNHLFPEWSQTT